MKNLRDDAAEPPSAFLEMFGDPVTNPKGWPVKKLEEVCTFYAGNSLPDGEPLSGKRVSTVFDLERAQPLGVGDFEATEPSLPDVNRLLTDAVLLRHLGEYFCRLRAES